MELAQGTVGVCSPAYTFDTWQRTEQGVDLCHPFYLFQRLQTLVLSLLFLLLSGQRAYGRNKQFLDGLGGLHLESLLEDPNWEWFWGEVPQKKSPPWEVCMVWQTLRLFCCRAIPSRKIFLILWGIIFRHDMSCCINTDRFQVYQYFSLDFFNGWRPEKACSFISKFRVGSFSGLELVSGYSNLPQSEAQGARFVSLLHYWDIQFTERGRQSVCRLYSRMGPDVPIHWRR